MLQAIDAHVACAHMGRMDDVTRNDAEQIKAQLAAEVVRIVDAQNLTDAEANRRSDVPEADLSRMRINQSPRRLASHNN